MYLLGPKFGKLNSKKEKEYKDHSESVTLSSKPSCIFCVLSLLAAILLDPQLDKGICGTVDRGLARRRNGCHQVLTWF